MHCSQLLMGAQAFPHSQPSSPQGLTRGRASLDVALAQPGAPSGAFSVPFSSDIRSHSPDSAWLALGASPGRAMPGLASALAPGQLAACELSSSETRS